jgi:hypothetical protein
MNSRVSSATFLSAHGVYACVVVTLVANSPLALQAQEKKEASPAPPAADIFEITPNKEPTIVLGYFDDRVKGQIPIFMEKQGKDLVIEGDIVLGPEERLNNKQGAKGLTDVNAKLWKNKTVPYVLKDHFPNGAAVVKAFDEYNNLTKIKFVKRTTEADYIEFVTTDNPNIGGQSRLGRVGGVQPLWLNQDVNKWTTGTVIHELGHALGLMHEQCRNDRNQFVEIVWANIMEGYKSQFQDLSNGRDLQAYDYESILHYPPRAFSANGLETIKPKQAGVVIGQRTKLSDGDIKSLEELYKME